jgi:hypothetical protein
MLDFYENFDTETYVCTVSCLSIVLSYKAQS